MPKTEVRSLFLIKMWDRAHSARQAGPQPFIRHESSEADTEDCPGISTGHANFFLFFFFFLNMVFIKKASISREVWYCLEVGCQEGAGGQGCCCWAGAEGCVLSDKMPFVG